MPISVYVKASRPSSPWRSLETYVSRYRGAVGQMVERELEDRVMPEAVGVVAVLVAGGDHQHPEADDLGKRVHGAAGITRIVDASGKTVGDFEPLLDLAQNQQTAVGRQPAAVEAGNDLLALDR